MYKAPIWRKVNSTHMYNIWRTENGSDKLFIQISIGRSVNDTLR